MGTKASLGTLTMAVALSAAVSSAAAADKEVASIARITGNALVNKGSQYVTGTEGMALSIGERVLSLEDTTAVIQFKDGCRYTMEENEVITIPSLSPCVLTKGPGNRLSVLPPVPPTETPVAAAVVAPATAAASASWVTGAAVGLVAMAGALLETGDGATSAPPISP